MENLEDKLDITLKDVVDIIADGYHIETLRFVSNYANKSYLYGLHIEEDGKKEILINRDLPTHEKRETILHELYHALYSKLGKKQNEKEVEALAQKKYKELYRDDSHR